MATSSKFPKPPTPKQEAASETTSPERLQELAKQNTELARLVAKNLSAAPDLLQELASSSDEKTRIGVITNPNTPRDVLLKLGAQFPAQLLDNPVFPLLLLENPNLLADMPLATLRSLLKRDVPPSFLGWAADNFDEGVLLAVAMNPNTPKSVLAKLLLSRNTEVVEAALLHVNWAGEMNQGWDEAAIEAMKTTSLEQNRDNEAKLSAIGAIPEFLLPVLQAEVRLMLAQNPNTPAHHLKLLAEDDERHSNIRVAIAQNPNTPNRLLEHLAGDRYYLVRETVAQNPNIDSSILQQFQAQQEATEMLETPPDTLTELAKSQFTHIRLGVACHPNTPMSALEQLAGVQDWTIRLAIGLNLNTPPNILEQLVEDKVLFIRTVVAYHPNASMLVLDQLATDADNSFILAGKSR